MQLLQLPRLPLRLAYDRALFGAVPRGATCRQLVMVQNNSPVGCGFAWDTTHPLWGELLSVYPSSGQLPPGGHTFCKLAFCAARLEAVDTTLQCDLTPQADAHETPTASFASTIGQGSRGEGSRGQGSRGQGSRGGSPQQLRSSVTEAQPKLRGMLALQEMEERHMRRVSRREARLMSAGMLPLADDGGTITQGGAEMGVLGLPPLQPKQSAIVVQREAPPLPPSLQLGIQATVLPPDVLAGAGGSLDDFYIPRSVPSDPGESPLLSVAAAPQQPAMANGVEGGVGKSIWERISEEQYYAAEAILSQMLRDAMGHQDVQRALETLEPEQTPWFGQIREAYGTPTPPPPSAPGGLLVEGGPPAYTERDASAMSEDELEAHLEEQDQAMRAQHRADERERKRREAEARAAVGDSSEFQELAAYVIEGTLFNLISEAALGEFMLDTLPRQIVRSLEINEQI